MAQGIILGVVLCLAHQRDTRPTILLGFFLLTYTIEIVPSLCVDLGYTLTRPSLFWLPLNFYFLSLPLLFLYGRRMTGVLNWRRDWKHLVAGGVEFGVLSVFFLLEAGGTNLLFSAEFSDGFQAVYMISGLVFSFSYALALLRLLRKHQGRLLEYHSNAAGKELRWLFWATVALLAFVVLLLCFDLGLLSLNSQNMYLFVTAINVVIIYYFAVAGVRQLAFRMPEEGALNEHKEKARTQVQGKVKKAGQAPKPRPDGLTDLQREQYAQLLHLMTEQRPYLEPQLTMTDLAPKVAMSERNLSRLINAGSGSHFNGFINGYRLAAAEKLLVDTAFEHYTMDAIALDAGFNSRATFYAAFRKKHGLTPAKFRAATLLSS